MRAGEVMTRDVVTVRPDAMIREAARLMDDLNVGALPVCEAVDCSASSPTATSWSGPPQMECIRTRRRCTP